MESTENIIVLPEYESLKADIEKFRVELSMLLLDRDELKFVICRNLETEYMLKIGGLEHQVFQKQCDAQRLKRKAEIIQAAINRQEKVDFRKVDALLEREFAAYQEKLDEQIRKMNEALKHSKGEILSPEETKELKSLYHKIVKTLHPDLNPNITFAQRQLFENAVSAYKNGDLLSFFREPDNPHDKEAIVVKTDNGVKIGYIPRKDNVVFARLMDAGKLLFGKIISVEMQGKWVKIDIGIYLHE